MRSKPLTATIGSEIEGVDLSRGISGPLADDLYELLLDRAVLVFRDQHLSSDVHLALGEVLGPLAPRHPLYPHAEGHEQVMVIRNDADNPPESESWHSDLSFQADPPFVSLLYGCVIPEAGGDTLWADMRAVHDALSAPMHALLAGLQAEHSQDLGFEYLRKTDQADRVGILDAIDARTKVAHHPILKRHPANGRGLLYVNEVYSSQVIGLSETESRHILGLLFDLIRQPRFQVRVRWHPGTLVVWDNWATQHFACGDHYPQPREVRRVTVLADRRTGPFSQPRQDAAA